MIHQWIPSFIIKSLNIIWGCLFVGQLDIDVSVERNRAGIVTKPVLVWSQSYSNESILRVCVRERLFALSLPLLGVNYSSSAIFFLPAVFWQCLLFSFFFPHCPSTSLSKGSLLPPPPLPLLLSLCKQANKQLPLVPGWLSVVPSPWAQRTPWQTHTRKPIHVTPNISEFCWESMLTNDQAWHNIALIVPIDLHWSGHVYHCMTVKLDLVTYAVCAWV